MDKEWDVRRKGKVRYLFGHKLLFIIISEGGLIISGFLLIN
jgi:hypothetical protein